MATDNFQTGELRASEHVPVLLEKAVELLNVRPGLTYVDATAGGGGHLGLIHKQLGNDGQVIALDRDLTSLDKLRVRFPDRGMGFAHANFADLPRALTEFGINTVSGGILADLGLSSMQINDPARGFSFMHDGPLDMRMDPSQSFTAQELVNTYSERDLANVIFQFGEERNSRAIARGIVQSRPLQSTLELANVIARVSGYRHRPQHSKRSKGSSGGASMHPATRAFQAIRIAVNGELDSLKLFLERSFQLLAPGARLVVISFHSLEDRLVKEFFRLKASDCICPPRQPVCTCDQKSELLIINRKPYAPDDQEVLANIRSRSAKLRAGEKLP